MTDHRYWYLRQIFFASWRKNLRLWSSTSWLTNPSTLVCHFLKGLQALPVRFLKYVETSFTKSPFPVEWKFMGDRSNKLGLGSTWGKNAMKLLSSVISSWRENVFSFDDLPSANSTIKAYYVDADSPLRALTVELNDCSARAVGFSNYIQAIVAQT